MTIDTDAEKHIEDEILKLKTETKLIARKRIRPSRLDVHSARLLALYRGGASKAELRRWLIRKGMAVEWTTVKRWIDKNG
ncbi:hypothetical protein L2728_00995 [Shewanella chilikensis]|uniref:hypothetical protein n=1 Tax=Shewanella TaxID=22 RepID=UPI001C585969|nr:MULTISPECIES: hypothetical protein [Shewanella]MCL1160471.1 hypothetical protein [Shewanella chilikensis]HDS1199609.1 hypothetical protein [Shewanella algae]